MKSFSASKILIHNADVPIETIAEMDKFAATVETIEIVDCSFPNAIHRFLLKNKFVKLKSLILDRTELSESLGLLVQIVEKAKALETISLRNNNLLADSVDLLCSILPPSTETIIISQNPIGSAGFRTLIRQNFAQLHVSYCEIELEGLQFISENNNLKKLSIMNNPFGVEGIARICSTVDVETLVIGNYGQYAFVNPTPNLLVPWKSLEGDTASKWIGKLITRNTRLSELVLFGMGFEDFAALRDGFKSNTLLESIVIPQLTHPLNSEMFGELSTNFEDILGMDNYLSKIEFDDGFNEDYDFLMQAEDKIVERNEALISALKARTALFIMSDIVPDLWFTILDSLLAVFTENEKKLLLSFLTSRAKLGNLPKQRTSRALFIHLRFKTCLCCGAMTKII
jgi:Leucine Rich repeat